MDSIIRICSCIYRGGVSVEARYYTNSVSKLGKHAHHAFFTLSDSIYLGDFFIKQVCQ